jgi:hypothetical protein
MYKVHKEDLEEWSSRVDIHQTLDGKKYSDYSSFAMYNYFFDQGVEPLKNQIINAFTGILFFNKDFVLTTAIGPKEVSGSVSPNNPNIVKINLSNIHTFWYLIKVVSHEYMHVLQNTSFLPGGSVGSFNEIAKPKELEAEFLGIINGLAVVRAHYAKWTNVYINEIEKEFDALKNSNLSDKEISYLFGMGAALRKEVRGIYYSDGKPLEKIYQIYQLGKKEINADNVEKFGLLRVN